MKEIIKITLSLTAICVAAALILGAVFAKTDHARKENEEKRNKELVQGLLGYGASAKAPENLKVYSVYRYVISEGKTLTLGYLVPLKDKKHALVQVDLSGKPGKVTQVDADETKLGERDTRDAAINGVLPKGAQATYAETFHVADMDGKRFGYVVEGTTQGFKTFVELMVSLEPDFTIKGVGIKKSEEDPGLGDEIKKDFFKNQFVGKTAELLKTLKVVKEPLPTDYLPALEPALAKRDKLSPDQVAKIKEKHVKDDIYALTGATISSRAVTNGVKDIVRKFVYRLDILTDALKKENVQVVF
ncbi:MAG TPA: FMN-binding protein [Desulfomonilaceae bacterium]|nr:FMN-binding protein [Desulfomonilaceae bacterium]